jgi:acid phosphatase type 7
VTPDSGGECGVAYESYFRMPAVSKDKPWYSIEQGSVHFVVMSTEHKWSEMSKQVYNQLELFMYCSDFEIYVLFL